VGPSDVAGVFSRYFIVGFFLPAFFVLVVLGQTLTPRFLPDAYEQLSDGAKIAVLGGSGLLLGLVLLGLNWQITRTYEGYPLAARRRHHVFRWIHDLLLDRQERTYDLLHAAFASATASESERTNAAWRLDREFPPDRDELLPTRFGNAVLAFERHAWVRWGLDSVVVWPRINLLLSEHEAEQQANARGEVAFFVNGSLLLTAAGLYLLADALGSTPLVGLEYAVYLVPFLVALLLARWAVGAAIRWGNVIRAAIDLHRLALYGDLGLRRPISFTEEREDLAPAINTALAYGRPSVPDRFFDRKLNSDQEEDDKDDG
jgi:hypothetical protein